MPLTELNRPALSIIYQAVDGLKPRSTNPRTHSKKQIGQIASAIRRFGFTNPVLVDDANGIVAGHGRPRSSVLIGRFWGRQRSQPKRSPASDRRPECNGGACSCGWNGAKP